MAPMRALQIPSIAFYLEESFLGKSCLSEMIIYVGSDHKIVFVFYQFLKILHYRTCIYLVEKVFIHTAEECTFFFLRRKGMKAHLDNTLKTVFFMEVTKIILER